MPLEISKQTYIEADEKTWRGATYDILDAISTRTERLSEMDVNIVDHCKLQTVACEKRFSSLELGWAKIAGGLVVVSSLMFLFFKFIKV